MEEITLDTLVRASDRLLFSLPPQEYETLLKEFKILLEEMEEVGKLKDLDFYEPMSFPFDCSTSILREDVPETPLSQQEVLQNAGSVQDGQIKIPKVIS